MIELTSENAKTGGIGHIGSQPIALAAAVLVIIVVGAGSIALWRAYTGTFPEQDRVVAARQLQVRTAQASEQLVEKTKGWKRPSRSRSTSCRSFRISCKP